MAKNSRAQSTTRKAKNMGIGTLGAMTPFIFDIVGPMIAAQIRDGLSKGGLDAVKSWFTGDKVSLSDLQRGLDMLPAEERVLIESRLAELNEQINLIQHSSLTEEEKRRRIESISRMYMRDMPMGPAGKATGRIPEAPASLGEIMSTWSPEMHALQREWFNLLTSEEQEKYTKHAAHLAPALAAQLASFVPAKDNQRRASQLTDVEAALRGRSLEQYKLWYRFLDSDGRQELADMAKSKLLTAAIIERVLELAEVPAAKIPDFEDFLDEAKLRKSHDEFIRHLDPGNRREFRDFRDRLHPNVLKEKLSGVRWTPDVARDVFIELENMAGRAGTFGTAEAQTVLDMIRDRQLGAPLSDDSKPKLDSDQAKIIFKLIKGNIPKPKQTVAGKAKEYIEIAKDLAGQADEGIKSVFPYDNLVLPDFTDEHELPKDYVARLVQEGALESYREAGEADDAFTQRLLADRKFMGKVDAKVDESIRLRKIAKIRGSSTGSILANLRKAGSKLRSWIMIR